MSKLGRDGTYERDEWGMRVLTFSVISAFEGRIEEEGGMEMMVGRLI